MKFRELERILLDDGWVYKTTKGSHYQYVHPTKPGKITVPNHNGKDLNIKTVKTILKQAGLE